MGSRRRGLWLAVPTRQPRALENNPLQEALSAERPPPPDWSLPGAGAEGAERGPPGALPEFSSVTKLEPWTQNIKATVEGFF